MENLITWFFSSFEMPRYVYYPLMLIWILQTIISNYESKRKRQQATTNKFRAIPRELRRDFQTKN